ncbi:MAG: adenosylcobinamide-phosphate synthase CbiB [Clostridia bacterium]|nr:adenosylcobinamide-phosphate synthase CbiB [Clostridia bacterium]
MTYMLLLDVLIAYLIDLLIGDPHWLPHPVRFIGWLIKRVEKSLRLFIKNQSTHKVEAMGAEVIRKQKDITGEERKAGIILTAVVVLSIFLAVFIILKLAHLVHPAIFHLINIYLIYSAIATKCMAVESFKVFDSLKERDIYEARKRLAMLVGRETDGLDEKDIIRGVVETTAENTVDGVVSPLVYAIVGSLFGLGAPLVYAFKAISTLDSMVGYMNKKYINFGWASAKLDDVANYIPARLTGVMIPLSALLCGKDFSKSFSIMLRDRRNHKSPNCAYPEAAVAGALGIRLGGSNVYFGEIVEKPTIGDPERDLKINDITDTINIMYVTSLVITVLGLGLCAIIVSVV